nr:hypothetical protein [uncultured Flavobacterium sp.]
MKLFISWSGQTSHQVALVLRNWIPKILHQIEPWVSSVDIQKGNIWNNELIGIVGSSKFAIICVTKYNLNSKWLNFEAGALSKFENSGLVCPFLFRMENSDLTGPLSQFQSVVSESSPEDIFKLLRSIRDIYGLTKPSDTTLNELVVKLYDDLKKDLDRITEMHKEDLSSRSERNFDPNSLFISTPMSAFSNNEELSENNLIINKAYGVLESKFDFVSIKCPSKNVSKDEDFADKESAIVEDLLNVQRSEYFLCIYPKKTTSSVLVEIGYAISKGKKCVILVKDREDLPFLLQEADKRITNLKIYVLKDFSEIESFLIKGKKGLFTFDRI